MTRKLGVDESIKIQIRREFVSNHVYIHVSRYFL